MVILRKIFCLSLFFLISCAKVGYIYEQGKGQISLLNNAIDNEKVLKDKKIPSEYKERIKEIEEYKNYFFKYFNKKPSAIYSKTTFLKTPAVSHMVIVSKFDKVKAEEECFPIVGCFPYLGFFNEVQAIQYAKDKEKEGYITWKRPIYAYSTLNYFTDTILSSFFYFKKEKLAEIIFHELLHTIFFIKNDVDMSESLAQFFGKELSYEYFNIGGAGKKKKRDYERKMADLRALIVELAGKLNEQYEKKKPKTMDAADQILAQFLDESFYPEINRACKNYQFNKSECFPLKSKWNNARFAAFMTYEKNVEKLRAIYVKSKLNLKEFYIYLRKEYDKYDDEDIDGTFITYLSR